MQIGVPHAEREPKGNDGRVHRQAGKSVYVDGDGMFAFQAGRSADAGFRPRSRRAKSDLRVILSPNGTGCRRERRAIAFLGRHGAGDRNRCSGVGSNAGPICAFAACDAEHLAPDFLVAEPSNRFCDSRTFVLCQRGGCRTASDGSACSINLVSANPDESWPNRGRVTAGASVSEHSTI